MSSSVRFFGTLLISTGIVLVILGLVTGIPNWQAAQLSSPDSDSLSPSPTSSQSNNLIVNLPAPQSIVSSPMLIRGKVYGNLSTVQVQLVTTSGLTLVNTTAHLQPITGEPFNLLQTSLVFPQPTEDMGSLQLQLVSPAGVIADQKTIPLIFK